MKSMLASKTLIMNVALGIASFILNHQGALGPLGLDAQMQTLIVAIANIVMRFFTKTAIVGLPAPINPSGNWLADLFH